jgi:hypothetical protein
MSTKSVFFVEAVVLLAVKHSTFTSPDHTHALLLFNTTREHVVCTRPKVTKRAES